MQLDYFNNLNVIPHFKCDWPKCSYFAFTEISETSCKRVFRHLCKKHRRQYELLTIDQRKAIVWQAPHKELVK